MIDVGERFASKFVRGDGDDCWLWTAAKNTNGYGAFAWTEERQAHRAAYRLMIGPIPNGAVVRHRCDTPLCVNPAHLLLGTQAQNMGDAVERDRVSRGAHHGNAKLTDAQAREILVSTDTALRLSKRYGVHPDLVRMIQRGARWAHLDAHNLPLRTQLRRLHGSTGEAHHSTHLTAYDVVAIRADTRTNREIGEAFRISPTTVSNIKNYKQWAHVPADPSDHRASRPVKMEFAPCSVPGCSGNASKGARGLCRAHYHRLNRYGSATARA